MKILHVLLSISILAQILFSATAFGEMSTAEAAQKANALYRSLTGGVPLLPSNPLYPLMVSRVKTQDYLGAAAVATDKDTGADEFYNNVVAALPQTFNQDGTAVGDRTEMSAQFLVAARDGLSLKDLLTKDFTAHDPTGTAAGIKYGIDDTLCIPNKDLGITGKICNTKHFAEVWSKSNPKKSLVQIGHPGFPGIGIYTSYPWADQYDRAGTGRRNIKGTMENLYCVTMDAMRTSNIPDFAIRQDIPRDDAGYVRDCKTCHSWMDNWVKPFLAKDITRINMPPINRFVWLSPVLDKLNDIRGPSYPVTSSAFDFFYSEEQDRILGIDPTKVPVQNYSATGVKFVHGENLRDFANIVATSRGYHRCMVKRIVAQIYMKKLFSFAIFSNEDQAVLDGQSDTIEAFTDIAMTSGDLGDLYRRIAVWYVFGQ